MLEKENMGYKRSKLFLDFHIAGFVYWDGALVAQELKVGDRLDLALEENNPYDPNAVAIFYQDNMLGYVPRDENAQLSQLLYFGHDIFEAVISQVNLEENPARQFRVSVRLKDARTPGE